jgi:GntR family transcriptional regulator
MAEPLLRADFTATALYTELAERCGVRLTGGTEHIRAVVPTAAERDLLGMPGDVAAFAIERTGYVGDRPVEWRHTLVRGDRFGLSAEFSAHTGYRLTPSPNTTALTQAW